MDRRLKFKIFQIFCLWLELGQILCLVKFNQKSFQKHLNFKKVNIFVI